MVRIKVTPHQLHECARQMRNAASEITEMIKRVEDAYQNLDLEMQSLDRLQTDYALVTGKAGIVANQLLTMSEFLERKAREFEQADQEGVSRLPATPPIQGNLPPATPNPQPWPFGPWPHISLPTFADLQRVGLTLLVIPPLVIDLAIGELELVGEGKDLLEVLQAKGYMDQMRTDYESYKEVLRNHPYDSPEAKAAYDKYIDGLKHVPVLGPWFEAQLKIDSIWGIDRGSPRPVNQGSGGGGAN